MITVTFETKRFRVQIIGKSVWIESSEGARWIFRSQHPLPLAFGVLEARRDRTTAVLRSAVDDFERTHDGDLALREALTGVRNVIAPEISNGHPVPAVPSSPAKPPSSVSLKRQDLRAPLRLPLAAQ
jgi:hypothetical protein